MEEPAAGSAWRLQGTEKRGLLLLDHSPEAALECRFIAGERRKMSAARSIVIGTLYYINLKKNFNHFKPNIINVCLVTSLLFL